MMSKQNLTISRENALATYDNTDANGRELLEHLFGKELFAKKDVTERINTFEDACNELGNSHPLVLAYQNTNLRDKEVADDNKDIIAYLKLRIIVAALNEGWEPQFVPGEYRWAPYFILYTKDEIDKMNEEERTGVVCRSSNNAYASGGVSFASSYYDADDVVTYIWSRLAFKSGKLAEYAGHQFIEIFADFMLGLELKK